MTPGQHVPLIPWATHIIQWRIQRVATGKPRANPKKNRLSSDWGLKLDPMKLDLLVIAGQLYRGEYVLKSCTHNKSAQQLYVLNGLNPFFRYITERSKKIATSREVCGGGSGCKRQPEAKKSVLTYQWAVRVGKILEKLFRDVWN